MASKGQRHIGSAHAFAVVGDGDETSPSLHRFDRDDPASGIEAVLDQLLHDGRRPLDDLARGNATDHVGWEDLNLARAGCNLHRKAALRGRRECWRMNPALCFAWEKPLIGFRPACFLPIWLRRRSKTLPRHAGGSLSPS